MKQFIKLASKLKSAKPIPILNSVCIDNDTYTYGNTEVYIRHKGEATGVQKLLSIGIGLRKKSPKW